MTFDPRTEHVSEAGPVDSSLQVHVIQMVLYKLEAGREVGLVKLVRDVPAERSELTTLLNGTQQRKKTKEQGKEGGKKDKTYKPGNEQFSYCPSGNKTNSRPSLRGINSALTSLPYN